MASMVHGTTSDSSSPAPANSDYRALPSLDRLLGAAPALIDRHGRAEATRVLRETLADARQAISLGQPAPSPAALLASFEARLAARAAPRLKPVFNLSGTVLHTNLGRATLPEEAIAAMVEAARSPCALEYDVASGGRGDRDDLVNPLIQELTGTQDPTQARSKTTDRPTVEQYVPEGGKTPDAIGDETPAPPRKTETDMATKQRQDPIVPASQSPAAGPERRHTDLKSTLDRFHTRLRENLDGLNTATPAPGIDRNHGQRKTL